MQIENLSKTSYKDIAIESARIVDLNVLRCWLTINACYMLSGAASIVSLFRSTGNSIKDILFVLFFYLGALTPFIYKVYYNKLSFLRRENQTYSYTVLFTNFIYMYILGFFSEYKYQIYVYAILMLISISLYQNTKLVLTMGASLFLIYIGFFILELSSSNNVSNTFALIILIMAIICAVFVTRGLKKYNELQSNYLLSAYDDSKEKNNELTNIKNQIKEAVIQIGDKIKINHLQTDNMSTSIQEVAAAIETFAASLQDINTGTVSIQSELDTLSQLATTMSDLSKDTNNYLLSSQDMLNVTREKSEQVNTLSESVNSSMTQLATNVSDIEVMVNMIKTVASQTSLLSLNASIEAARAGDAGRGFSVVAEEIRKLSDSTNESVTQIEAMMQSINESVVQTSQNIDMMKNEIEEQSSCVDNAQISLHRSTDAIGKLLTSVHGVTNGVVKVASVNKSVVDSTSSISALSEEIAANTESISSLSISIAQETNHIDEINTQLVNDF